MFVVYTTKDNLIRLCLENDNSWYKIITRVKKVVLSEEEDWRDNPLLLKMHQSGVDFLTVEQSVINDIITNHPEYVLDDPCSAYLLDIDAEKAKTIQSKFGVICQEQTSNANVLTQRGWNIDVMKTDDGKSWESFFSGHNCPVNSLLIIDRYFFSSEVGETIEDSFNNLKQILNALLPLNSPDNVQQVALVFDFSTFNHKDKKDDGSEYTFKALAEKVNKIKRSVRNYSYSLELLSINSNCYKYEDTHDRRIFTNYSITIATHKLKAFRKNSNSLCSQNISFRRLFSDGLEAGDKSTLPAITQKNIIRLLQESIKTSKKSMEYAYNGQVAKRGEFEIKNRLLTFF